MLNARDLAKRYGPYTRAYIEQLITLALSKGDDVGAFELLAILDEADELLKNTHAAHEKRD